ncbi:MAG: hypothetical protein C0513_08830, partial [Isosphaera sp.]|nr:hypothetical protein [Isosphaera sp.]
MKIQKNLLAIVGVAGSLAPVAALAQGPASLVNISGATLQQNFINNAGSVNDFIDVNFDGLSGGLGTALLLGAQNLRGTITSTTVGGTLGVSYRISGSVQGVVDLVNHGRVFNTQPALNPDGTTNTLSINPIVAATFNGSSFVSIVSNVATATGIANVANPAFNPARSDTTSFLTNRTGTFTSIAGAVASPGGVLIDIAPSDVPSSWVFRVDAPAPTSRTWDTNPATPGYGDNLRLPTDVNGNPIASATNANRLPNLLAPGQPAANFFDPSNPASANENTIFDTPTAWAPVGLFTNYGTGRTQIQMTEIQHIYTTGRLPSGENLAALTRGATSGTRNAFNNSTGVDPSFGVGDNIGGVNTVRTLGPTYVPSNKSGSGDIEAALLNTRLGIGYTGAERGTTGSPLLTPTGLELLAVQNNHLGGTGFHRPESQLVTRYDNEGYLVGGPAVFITFGDPRAEAALDGGADWPAQNWDRDTRPLRPAGLLPTDPTFFDFKDAVRPATEPANTNPQMRNQAGAEYINNITRSAEAFLVLPGGSNTAFQPGELLSQLFVAPQGLVNLPSLADPQVITANSGFSSAVQSFVNSFNALSDPAYDAFNLSGIGPVPTRLTTGLPAGFTYSDGLVASYVNEAGINVSYGTALTLRNKISGDFNGDGLRTGADIPGMVAAWRERNGGPNWVAPNGTGLPQSQGGIAGAPGSDFVIEIVGDFNGDGSFTALDIRYFADGLNLVNGQLDRPAGFLAVDNAFGGNFFGTALAGTGASYENGDSRGDIASGSRGNTPGFAPTADLVINATDIDYVYRQFSPSFGGVANLFVTDGQANWANIDEAIGFDLSADLTGDLIVDINDVNDLVSNILETSIGDVNLDGVVNNDDLSIAEGNVGTNGGWAAGDTNGDGVVTQADVDFITSIV